MARYKPSKDLWEARKTLPNGKRVSKYAKTAEEAERLVSIAAGALPKASPDDGTVRGFIRRNVWPKYSAKEGATRDQARWAIDNYILPEIGDVAYKDIEPWHCEAVLARVRDGWRWNEEEEEWEAGKTRTGWSVRTVRKHLARAVRLMARQRLIPYNYLEEIDCDETEREEAVLTAQEIFSLWTENKDRPIGLPVLLCGLVGLRRGEALARTAEDVGTSLLVRSQRVYERRKGVRDKVKLKTLSSPREIALPECLEAICSSYAKGKTHLCVGTDGSPMFPTSLRKMLLEALKKSGLPPCSLQSMRSTFQTAMDEIGCPRGVLQGIVGHSPSTVTDGYIHATQDAMRHWLGKLMDHASTWPGGTAGVPVTSSTGVQTEVIRT